MSEVITYPIWMADRDIKFEKFTYIQMKSQIGDLSEMKRYLYSYNQHRELHPLLF